MGGDWATFCRPISRAPSLGRAARPLFLTRIALSLSPLTWLVIRQVNPSGTDAARLKSDRELRPNEGARAAAGAAPLPSTSMGAAATAAATGASSSAAAALPLSAVRPML